VDVSGAKHSDLYVSNHQGGTTVEKTKDYTIFQTITGNRDVNPKHVEDLIQAIKRKNLLQYFPVLLNEYMQIIDGQHREAACEELEIEVPYVVVPGLTLDDVMSINTNSKSWTMIDFVEAYIKKGNKAYQELLDFSQHHDVSMSISASLLHGPVSASATSLSMNRLIKEGKFVVRQREWADMMLSQIHDLQPFADFLIKKDRDFIRALSLANHSPNFEFAKFTAKLQIYSQRILAKAVTRYYLIEIEELYNKGNHIYIDIYASSRGGARMKDDTDKIDEAIQQLSKQSVKEK
jgi:ParB-like nuclease domain